MEHSTWLNLLFDGLENYGDEGRTTVAYLRAQHTKIDFKRTKPSIGAWWTLARNINLNTKACTKIIEMEVYILRLELNCFFFIFNSAIQAKPVYKPPI